MRDMDVRSHGNVYNPSQLLPPNPRRAGLPSTVTEWRNQRRAALAGEGPDKHPGPATQSSTTTEDSTAFAIVNSGKPPYSSSHNLRSRINNSSVALNSNRNTQAAMQGTNQSYLFSKASKRKLQSRNKYPGQNIATDTPLLSLDPQDSSPYTSQGSTGLPADDEANLEVADLGRLSQAGHGRNNHPEGFLYALQEPAIVSGKLVNIKNVIQIMDTKCMNVPRNPTNPRAAIICSIHLNMWPVTEFCTRDMAVGLLKGSNLGDIYVVSLYCDGAATRAVPKEFRRFRHITKKENKQVLVLMDTNSHSEVLWSSKSTCPRGREWERYISHDPDLIISNVGDHFTFMSQRGQTLIDVTMSTTTIDEQISHWSVVDCVTNSDHLAIEMLLHIKGAWNSPPATWDFSSKRFDKDLFIAKMEASSEDSSNERFWDPDTLDKNGQSFVDDMTKALDLTCPLRRRSTNIARPGWFDTECKRLLRRCKQIRQYLRNWFRKRRRRGLPDFESNKQKYTWNDYIDCRKAFRRRCRRVKRRHWRRFITGIGDTETVARLSKRLDKNTNAELSCFRDETGKQCTPAETVQQLKDTHFPNSLNVPSDKAREFLSNGVADIMEEKADFITPTSVSACVNSFKSHKAPGPDGLQVFPFKLLGPKALRRLTRLIKASYLLGAMPECFRLVRIIFIPKLDKPSYDHAKAHRPISLMNNIMKIPEKLFLWRQEDTNLVSNPLEEEQHGFVKCRSCDSAITVVVSHIEHALMRDWFGVVAFLDFQGAYDNLQYPSMEKALLERGTDPNIIAWYKDFFYHRKSIMDIKGVHAEIYHSQGAPQGGIGSPYLWSAVLNELIKIIKVMEGIIVVAYADDLCLMAFGPDKDECIRTLQNAVDAVMTWAGTHLLALSPTKSETILFTKRRSYPTIIDTAAKIKINGVSLNYERGSVRYLGIWLDRNLNWADHLKIKTRKVKGLLFKLAGISGDLWGYKPLIGKYCWEGLARPVLSYGCLGWIPALMRKKTVDKQLTSVQRLGYKLMAFFRRSTPNKGLDMIFNIMPIKYHLLDTAARSYIRTMGVAPFNSQEMHTPITSRVSHRTWIEEFIGDFDLDYLCDPLDSIPPVRKWNKCYMVDMQSMSLSSPSAGKPRYLADIDAYTDGSKDPDPEKERTGAGIVLMRGKKMLILNKRWAAYKYKLLAKNTVFQAEIFAIKKLCEFILDQARHQDGQPWVTKDLRMDIYCDSKSAIMALNSITIQSELVDQTNELLNQVAQTLGSLTIRWIRGHQGHVGNERADKMARRGRDSPAPPDPDAPKIAKATMKSELELAARKLWKVMWNMDPTCRQSKMWFPDGPRPGFAFEILHLPRPVCSQVIHFVTGHNFLRRHQAIIELAELEKLEKHEGLGEDEEFHAAMEPIAACSLCGGKEESSFHIMTECPKLVTVRVGVFGKEDILPPYTNIPVYKLISYLRDVKLKSLEMRPFIEEYRAAELPERMPDWAKVNGNDSSSDDEFQADQRAARVEGNLLLHQLLYQKYSAQNKNHRVRMSNHNRY